MTNKNLQQVLDSITDDYVLVPKEPTKEMLDRAVAFALNVKLNKEYTWTDYTSALYKTMIAAAPKHGGRDGNKT